MSPKASSEIAMASVRDSNMESVRIIAITIIVVWHFMVHGGIMDYHPWTQILQPLVYGGVPLFVLISGWYLIEIKLKSIIRLLCTVWIFYFVTEAVIFIHEGEVDLGRLFFEVFSPLSRFRLWFIGVYTALLVFSPMINKALKNVSIADVRKFMVLLSLFEFYSCWVFDNRVDDKGYSLTTFLYLYLLGYYLRREPAVGRLSNAAIVAIGVVSLLINMGISAFFAYVDQSYIFHRFHLVEKYSNPFLIITCASVILLFSRMRFRSAVINSLAPASLGVYMLQDGELGDRYLYPFSNALVADGAVADMIGLIAGTLLGLWVASWLLMFVVRWLTDFFYLTAKNILHKHNIPV